MSEMLRKAAPELPENLRSKKIW